MKSNEALLPSELLELALCIYKDACAKCTADVSDLRDEQTISSRVKDEGMSFLTITLPGFSRDFESSLQTGFIAPTAFRRFRKWRKIPAFLRGLTGLIFNYETGRLIDDDQFSSGPCERATVIDSIRQVCLAFKKVELPCTPERVDKALTNFVSIEHELSMFSLSSEEMAEFSAVSSVLWDPIMARLELSDMVPRHGPGTTADKRTGNGKFVWHRWHERLEPFFPLLECAYTIGAFESEELQLVTLVKPEQEQSVRIVTVPKTLKSPRIIAIEPCCMQYSQQAVLGLLMRAIESSKIAGGHINFRDQSVNQELAMTSSKTGQFATIDLSDASDRVPRDLALKMFDGNADLRDAIESCRTTSAEMPDGTILSPLNKFASMGSALCFPIESMYFYTICVMALLREHSLPVNRDTCYRVTRDVYVYGDDIVVPTTSAVVILDYLQKYNCKVNTSKTFISGKFRESCGVDAYEGELVNPVYVGTRAPKYKRQASELVSWVATANLFYRKGYWKTAQLMFCTCEQLLGPLPYVSESSPGLGRVTVRGYRSIQRWNESFQRFEVRCWVPRPVYRSDCVDGYPALVKCLSLLGSPLRDQPIEVDEHHLERSALRGAVALKRRWVPSY